MIRLVVAMGALAFAVSAPAWAQERRQKHELRQEQRLAERPDFDAPDLDVDDAPEAGENDTDSVHDAFTTDDLEGLDEPSAETSDEASDETPREASEESSEEEGELIEARAIPPDAGRAEASAIPGGPTFQQQMGRLVADLQYDRTSGREYARAPERGRESVMQEVSLTIREQLVANDCWGAEDAILPGRRESIAIALRFDVDGHFIEDPRLVSPPEMPSGDLPLRLLIDRTFGALRACNTDGFKLPAQYFEDPIWVYFILQSRPE